jgi:hypothetical protein
MRNLVKLALLFVAASTFFGCAHNYYNIPQETLEKRVKTVGVAPLFTDADSDIRHPDKAAVVSLIKQYNAKNEKELIARLRSSGIFYSVRQVPGNPDRLFSTLVSSKERRDDAKIVYNKYFYNRDEVKKLIAENGLDAILFVTVSGLTTEDKVYSSNFLAYLETDYNYLTMTAQMLDRDGTLIWEYPNFRKTELSYPLFFPLQYPDFDEATANLSEKVDVKFKTVAGVNAAFAQTVPSVVENGPRVSTLYARQFDEITALLKPYKPFFGKKEKKGPESPAQAAPAVAPSAERYMAPAPIVTAPAPAPQVAPAPAASAPATQQLAPIREPVATPDGFTSRDIAPEVRPAK